jgi:peroxiredoxin
LTILSVDIADERDKVEVYAREQGLTFAILLDSDSTAAAIYRVRGIPTSFFIDREGVVHARHTGALDEALIDRYVEQLPP